MNGSSTVEHLHNSGDRGSGDFDSLVSALRACWRMVMDEPSACREGMRRGF
jgi:hypothetical protein